MRIILCILVVVLLDYGIILALERFSLSYFAIPVNLAFNGLCAFFIAETQKKPAE